MTLNKNTYANFFCNHLIDG